ncbi:MAG: hypothetical protein HZA46_09635 [Planctomycetales bacterium]|nr:hypothetical protein [Planctomycetales bacterium]
MIHEYQQFSINRIQEDTKQKGRTLHGVSSANKARKIQKDKPLRKVWLTHCPAETLQNLPQETAVASKKNCGMSRDMSQFGDLQIQ